MGSMSASTDRTVGRILDNLAQLKQVTPCPMVGPYKPALAHESALFSRVSYTANSLRYAVRSLREGGVLPERWSDPAVWRLVLEPSDLDAASCAQAALSATQQTAADWRVESSLAGGQVQGILLEDWSDSAWEHPHQGDARTGALASQLQADLAGHDYAMYSDGGLSGLFCTCSAQACCFGPLGAYWEQLGESSIPIQRRLPARFGYEDTNVHVAELMGMINALRWRRPGQWNMLVCDRCFLRCFEANMPISGPVILWNPASE